MRLKLILKADCIQLPRNYQHTLQGAIYKILQQNGFDESFHDAGFGGGEKKYKLFVFSGLRGKYTIVESKIRFEDTVAFSIASQYEPFLQTVYSHIVMQRGMVIAGKKLELEKITVENLPYFSGLKKIKLRLISPVTAYRTIDRKQVYYSPETDIKEFEQLCLSNLRNKMELDPSPNKEFFFKVLETDEIRKQIVWIKNTFYIGYLGDITIAADYYALLMVMNTGLSAKGSSGFGMVEILHEEPLSI